MGELTGAEVMRLANEMLEEREAEVRVKKSIMARLRAQYVEVEPIRRIPPGTWLWPSNTPELIVEILIREEAGKP